MYDVKSMKAEEFIDHNEIMATLEYAAANKNNENLSTITRLWQRWNMLRPTKTTPR